MNQPAGAALSQSAHRFHEDVAAMLTGAMFMALGVTMYSKAMLVSGGTAGLALLAQHASGYDFGLLFFVFNLPFYGLSLSRMGWKLTARTIAAVFLVSAFATWTRSWIDLDHLHPLYAACMGGSLMGVGLLILFRHRASLGGVNLMALYLQEKRGLRAGYVQLGVDAVILLGGLLVVEPDRIALSLAGAAVLNLILATNHRPGRYTGVS